MCSQKIEQYEIANYDACGMGKKNGTFKNG